MVIADDNLFSAYFTDEDVPDVRFRRLVGKIARKRCDDKVIDARTGQEFYFFFDIADESQTVVFGMQNHSRVGKEGEQHGFASALPGTVLERAQYFLMPYVYAIECADGYYGVI